MSELITANKIKNGRFALLTSVSAGALVIAMSAIDIAIAKDLDRPTVWIELGGQLNRNLNDVQFPDLPFAQVAEDHDLPSLTDVEKPPAYGFGETLALSIQPQGSLWSFSASVQYGKSNKLKQEYQALDAQVYHAPFGATQYPARNGLGKNGPAKPAVDYTARFDEQHVVADFQVGRDVGIGLLGNEGSSRISFGVRFAQMISKSKLKLYADPYPHMSGTKYVSFLGAHGNLKSNTFDQFYKAFPEFDRSFRGIGPELSWSGSIPLVRMQTDSSIGLDLGVNAGLLFGRQKASIHHHTTGTKWENHINKYAVTHGTNFVTNQYIHRTEIVRSRSVAVPNVGGLIGASLNFPNAKVSFGYRADFFFGAVDGGIDVRRTEDVGFHGPFATISIGVGG